MRTIGRSLAFALVGMVALGILLTQPSRMSVPLEDHCLVQETGAEPVRMDRVYRFDPNATPVGPAPVLEDGPAPTPESYQYYAIPLNEGPVQGQGTPTPCSIRWPTTTSGTLYPTPATVTPNAAGTPEVFHAGYSGIPQLEAAVDYTGGQQGNWQDYEAQVTDSEWVTKPGFVWGNEDDEWSLLALLQHWQTAAALVLLLGIIRLAWPNVESGMEQEE